MSVEHVWYDLLCSKQITKRVKKKKYRKPNECVVIYWSSVDDLNNNNKRTHVHITNVVLRTKSTHKRIVRVRSIH